MHRLVLLIAFLVVAVPLEAVGDEARQPLPGTKPLTWQGDLASRMVAGIDKSLLRETASAPQRRDARWQLDDKSDAGWEKFATEKRSRLAHILGVRDKRVPFEDFELLGTLEHPALIAERLAYKVYRVRWPVLDGVHGDGLLLVPHDPPRGDVIAIPHCDVSPEQIADLSPQRLADLEVDGRRVLPYGGRFASYLASAGYRVLVPALISRDLQHRGPPEQPSRARLTNREYLYRPSFELGRHVIGYEVQMLLAAIDCFEKQAEKRKADAVIGVVGYGEGGMLALYAAALDDRVDHTCVGGYFGSRSHLWQEPIDRNVFGLLEEFGDAELASLQRHLIVDDCPIPEQEFAGKDGGAPGKLVTPMSVAAECKRGEDLVTRLRRSDKTFIQYIQSDDDPLDGSPPRSSVSLFAEILSPKKPTDDLSNETKREQASEEPARKVIPTVKLSDRQQRQISEIENLNQRLLAESPYLRSAFMQDLDTSSLAAYETSTKPYRRKFREEIIGRFNQKLLPPQPRSRQAYKTDAWTGYDVVLDVFPDVFAYGILLVPKDLKREERRPVVVCQHGLEGRPQDIVSGDHRAYHDFAAKLAERGFITFAPQNPYIFRDRFRSLQRKANPLGKTLFSIIVPQHQQIVNWLGGLDFVDKNRIGFYGLSYGGKTAMRVPALVDGYCLSICSADFNDWIWKNASTRSKYSYVWTGEYEIFEFDLANTFNYSEMAALIAPRPFMVERGHFDGVAPDERVALEYAKVRHLYAARLGIGDRTEIEWFAGPHTINGEGTFAFLHKHLNWPEPE